MTLPASSSRWLPRAALFLSLSLLTACGDDVSEASRDAGGDAEVDGDAADAGRHDAGDEAEACAGEDDGTPCGPTHHCIDERCMHNYCGDGVLAEDEECDDGDETLGDGCSPSCRFSPGPTCGDGRRDPGEECDDGNLQDDDRCTTGCLVNECGNGRRDVGEDCDDGDDDDFDYCTRACERIVCRNGRLDPGEECDDGNGINDDGCTNDCRAIRCGDGIVETEAQGLVEECDDGNDVDDDACSNACTENVCGNKRIDPGELCDGNQEGNEFCNPTCDGFETSECIDCQVAQCNQFSGTIRLYDGCRMDAGEPFSEVFPGQPLPEGFVERCTALDECVQREECGKDERGLAPCFCGDLSVSECQVREKLEGPCADEAVGAIGVGEASCTGLGMPEPLCVIGQSSDFTRPIGWATFLAQCRRESCAQECGIE